jgi:hypothetical protein
VKGEKTHGAKMPSRLIDTETSYWLWDVLTKAINRIDMPIEGKGDRISTWLIQLYPLNRGHSFFKEGDLWVHTRQESL